MEDNKNAMRLDDEKLEQVAGGSGSDPYTDCPIYQLLLRIKNSSDVEHFRDELRRIARDDCSKCKNLYSCWDCPAPKEWIRQ